MKEGGREINLEGLLGSGEGPFEAGACDFVAIISLHSVVISIPQFKKRKIGKTFVFRQRRLLTS